MTLNGGACLIVDVDPARLARRVEHRYLDEVAPDLDTAIELAVAAKRDRRAWSVGVVGNAAEVFPELRRRGVPIDIVTDQTSAHDPLSYLPVSYTHLDVYKRQARPNPWPARRRNSRRS